MGGGDGGGRGKPEWGVKKEVQSRRNVSGRGGGDGLRLTGTTTSAPISLAGQPFLVSEHYDPGDRPPDCPICCQPMIYSSFGKCSDIICWVCSAKLRKLQGSKDCPFCKVELPYVVVVKTPRAAEYLPADAHPVQTAESDANQRRVALHINGSDGNDVAVAAEDYLEGWLFSQYSLEPATYAPGLVDEKLGVIFSSPEAKRAFDALSDFICWHPTCTNPVFLMGGGKGKVSRFATRDACVAHSAAVHGVQPCKVCLSALNVFPFELSLYTPSDMERHVTEGDRAAPDGAVGVLEPHRLCAVCKQYQFNLEALTRHHKEAHLSCYICDERAVQSKPPTAPPAFGSFAELGKHYRDTHITCPLCEYVALRDPGDLALHNAQFHRTPGGPSGSQVNLARFAEAHRDPPPPRGSGGSSDVRASHARGEPRRAPRDGRGAGGAAEARASPRSSPRPSRFWQYEDEWACNWKVVCRLARDFLAQEASGARQQAELNAMLLRAMGDFLGRDERGSAALDTCKRLLQDWLAGGGAEAGIAPGTSGRGLSDGDFLRKMADVFLRHKPPQFYYRRRAEPPQWRDDWRGHPAALHPAFELLLILILASPKAEALLAAAEEIASAAAGAGAQRRGRGRAADARAAAAPEAPAADAAARGPGGGGGAAAAPASGSAGGDGGGAADSAPADAGRGADRGAGRRAGLGAGQRVGLGAAAVAGSASSGGGGGGGGGRGAAARAFHERAAVQRLGIAEGDFAVDPAAAAAAAAARCPSSDEEGDAGWAVDAALLPFRPESTFVEALSEAIQFLDSGGPSVGGAVSKGGAAGEQGVGWAGARPAGAAGGGSGARAPAPSPAAPLPAAVDRELSGSGKSSLAVLGGLSAHAEGRMSARAVERVQALRPYFYLLARQHQGGGAAAAAGAAGEAAGGGGGAAAAAGGEAAPAAAGWARRALGALRALTDAERAFLAAYVTRTRALLPEASRLEDFPALRAPRPPSDDALRVLPPGVTARPPRGARAESQQARASNAPRFSRRRAQLDSETHFPALGGEPATAAAPGAGGAGGRAAVSADAASAGRRAPSERLMLGAAPLSAAAAAAAAPPLAPAAPAPAATGAASAPRPRKPPTVTSPFEFPALAAVSGGGRGGGAWASGARGSGRAAPPAAAPAAASVPLAPFVGARLGGARCAACGAENPPAAAACLGCRASLRRRAPPADFPAL